MNQRITNLEIITEVKSIYKQIKIGEDKIQKIKTSDGTLFSLKDKENAIKHQQTLDFINNIKRKDINFSLDIENFDYLIWIYAENKEQLEQYINYKYRYFNPINYPKINYPSWVAIDFHYGGDYKNDINIYSKKQIKESFENYFNEINLLQD